MAKSKYKKIKGSEVEAEQFDASAPEQQWPERVQVNAGSATGYSYGTLEPIIDEENQTAGRDGFELSDTDWLIYENDVVTMTTNDDFIESYEEKS